MKPRVACGAIIKKGNKILLTKRNINPYKDYWCLPGGHVEQREKVEKAIRREVKEETGLNFKPNFFGYYDEIFPKRNWYAVTLIFTGKASGKIKTDKSEVKELRCFLKEEFKKIKLAFNHQQILKDYFKRV